MRILAVHNRYQRPGGEDQVESKYTAERNYRALMEIYEAVLERKKVPA